MDSANGFAWFALCVCLALGWAKVVTQAEAGTEIGVDAEVEAEVDAAAGTEVDDEVGVGVEVLFF